MQNTISPVTSSALQGVYARNHHMQVSHAPDGDGGGQGQQGAAGDEGGQGGGQGAVTPHSFTDENATVLLPGMKEPVSVKDLAGAYGLRTHHEQGVKLMGQIAQAIKAQGAGRQGQPQGRPQPQGRQTQPQQQQQTQAEDVLAGLEGMDLPDGKTLAGILRKIGDTRLDPMARLVVKMAERLETLEKGVGGFQRERDERDFGVDLDKAIAGLKLPAKIEGGTDVIRELARDLFFSYDEADWPKLRGETFNKALSERVQALFKFVRAHDKAHLAQEQERLRKNRFVRPGAGSSGNGKGKLPTNQEMADALFATPGQS